MVEHRLFVTGEAPRRPQRLPRRGALFPDVAVMLGDPRLPDPVKRNGQWNEEDAETLARLKTALTGLPGYRFRYLDNHATLFSRSARPPAAIRAEPLRRGVQQRSHLWKCTCRRCSKRSIFRIAGQGRPVSGSATTRRWCAGIAETLDVPVPAETYFNADDLAATIPSGVFPALIKPNFGDSSIGITQDAVVHSWEEAIRYLNKLRQQLPGCPILIQEFLTGPEYSLGIIGNPGRSCRVLPVLEIDYSRLDPELPRLLTYKSKWEPASPYWTQIGYREGRLDEDTRRKMVDYSTILFERLGCRDYARFDFRADATGEIKLLEVNPNPGWCWDGKLNLMAEMAGLGYADLLRLIIEAAQERVAAQQPGLVIPLAAAPPCPRRRRRLLSGPASASRHFEKAGIFLAIPAICAYLSAR